MIQPPDQPDQNPIPEPQNTRDFEFVVSPTGEFSFIPDGDWAYHAFEKLRFISKAGPFAITARRIDQNPWEGGFRNPIDNLEGRQIDEYTWVAETEVNDGLTTEERSQAASSNEPPAPGFLAKYRYFIGVIKDGRVLLNDAHNGTYYC